MNSTSSTTGRSLLKLRRNGRSSSSSSPSSVASPSPVVIGGRTATLLDNAQCGGHGVSTGDMGGAMVGGLATPFRRRAALANKAASPFHLSPRSSSSSSVCPHGGRSEASANISSNDAGIASPTTAADNYSAKIDNTSSCSWEYKKDDDHYSYATTQSPPSSSSQDDRHCHNRSPVGGSSSSTMSQSPSSFSSSGECSNYYSRDNNFCIPSSSPTNDDSSTTLSLDSLSLVGTGTKTRKGGHVINSCCQCCPYYPTHNNTNKNNNNNNNIFILVMIEMTRIISLLLMILLVIPIIIWNTYPNNITNIQSIISNAILFWNSILQFPVWPVVLVTVLLNAATATGVTSCCSPPMQLNDCSSCSDNKETAAVWDRVLVCR